MDNSTTISQLGKMLPQAVESEEVIVSEVINYLSYENVNKCMTTLLPEMFYKEDLKTIFAAAKNLYDQSKKWDLIILGDELRRLGQLEAIGGHYRLMQLNISTGAITEHLEAILGAYYNRELIKIGSELTRKSFEYENPFTLMSQINEAVNRMYANNPRSATMNEIIKDTMTEIGNRIGKDGAINTPLTGVITVDNLIYGAEEGDLIIVAGRPGMGKSMLGVNILRHTGVERHVPVSCISLEMSEKAYLTRIFCAMTDIDSRSVKEGAITQSDLSKLTMAASQVSEAPVTISDLAGVNIHEIKREIYSAVSKNGSKIVIIDHGGLIAFENSRGNPVQEIGKISSSLKQIAKALNITVVLLWQLSREVEKELDKRPKLRHLRDSGTLEQDADKVIFLLRPAYYNITQTIHDNKTYDTDQLLEVIVAKHRDGPTGIRLAKVDVTTSLITNLNIFDR